MAVLSDKLWTGECIQMKLHIDENTVYVASSIQDEETGIFIQSASFSKSDGNTNVNPLGIASSDSVNLSIFDPSDNLSPANTNSPYYGKLASGLKMEMFISKDRGQTWSPFGVYYTNNFSGSYSEGYHNLVSISAADRLNILGNELIPELNVYANVTLLELLETLFDALGYSKDEYYIDPKVDLSEVWGVLPGTKVRDFINSVCQRTFSRVIINAQGVIEFVPALDLATNYNELVLEPEDVGELKNASSDNINYSKVNVKYDVYGTVAEVTAYSNDSVSLAIGHNIIDDITFANTVVCIKNVYIRYRSELNLAKIENVEYVAFGDGMILELDVLNANVFEVSIQVEAVVKTTIEKTATVSLNTNGRLGLTEYTLDVDNQMTDEAAQKLCNDIVEYLKRLENKISISGTVLTPDISIGDQITLQNTGTLYDGVYKVTSLQIEFSESYSLNAELIRLNNLPSDDNTDGGGGEGGDEGSDQGQ